MTSRELIDSYVAILDRLGLSNATAAALTGLSEHTVRIVRLGRTLPKHERCRTAMAAFVSANKSAKCRADLRVV